MTKAEFRAGVKRLHPDRGGDPAAFRSFLAKARARLPARNLRVLIRPGFHVLAGNIWWTVVRAGVHGIWHLKHRRYGITKLPRSLFKDIRCGPKFRYRMVRVAAVLVLLLALTSIAAGKRTRAAARTYNGTTNSAVTPLPTPLSDFPPLPPGFFTTVGVTAEAMTIVTNITFTAGTNQTYTVTLLHGAVLEMSGDGMTWGEAIPDTNVYGAELVGYDHTPNGTGFFRIKP